MGGAGVALALLGRGMTTFLSLSVSCFEMVLCACVGRKCGMHVWLLVGCSCGLARRLANTFAGLSWRATAIHLPNWLHSRWLGY